MRVWFLLCLGLVILFNQDVQAEARTKEGCKACIVHHEKQKGIEPGLLQAIVQVESKMAPYAVNVSGRGYNFSSVEEAAQFVRQKQEQGIRNVSVGVAQLHVPSHRGKFKSVEEMMDPEKNVAYAANYLKKLKRETGSWERAVKRYHSPNPVASEKYKNRVFGVWAKICLRQGQWGGCEPSAARCKGFTKANYRMILSSEAAALRLACLKNQIQAQQSTTPQSPKGVDKKTQKQERKTAMVKDTYNICNHSSCDSAPYHTSQWDHYTKLDKILAKNSPQVSAVI